MTKAHFIRVAQDNDGNALTGASIAVYEPATTNFIADTLYSNALGTATLTNPFTTTDGVISLYLNTPKRVRIGVTPVGGSQFFFEDLDINEVSIPVPGAGLDGKPTVWDDGTKSLIDGTASLDARYDAIGAASTAAALAESDAIAAAAQDATAKAIVVAGTYDRNPPPLHDEIYAVGVGNVDVFTSWLNAFWAGLGPVAGIVGEVGIPHNPKGINPITARHEIGNKVAGTPGGANSMPATIDSGRWMSMFDGFLRYLDGVNVAALPYTGGTGGVSGTIPGGIPVFTWECREYATTGLSVYGPDPGTGNTGPLAYAYPSAQTLESHNLTLDNAITGPFRGTAFTNGIAGFTATTTPTIAFDTTPYNEGSGVALRTEYNYTRAASWDFVASRGIHFIRLTIRMERLYDETGTWTDSIQTSPTSVAGLKPLEMQRLDNALSAAKAAGVFVMLDAHQGAALHLTNGTQLVRHTLQETISPGGAKYGNSLFIDFWTKIASHYATGNGLPDTHNPNITGRNDLRSALLGYELMNEPLFYYPTTYSGGSVAIDVDTAAGDVAANGNYGYTNAANDWQVFSRAAGRAVRAIDSTITLFVQAYGGGSAASSFWTYHAGGPWMTQLDGTHDPATNYVMHTYFDSTGGGKYVDTYDNTRTIRQAQGYTAKPQFRVLGQTGVPLGNTLFRKISSSVTGSNNPAVAASTLINGTVRNVYTNTTAGTIAIASAFNWSSNNTGALNVYIRPSGTALTQSPLATWERWRPTLSAGWSSSGSPGPTFLNFGDAIDVLLTGVASTAEINFDLYSVPQGNYKIVKFTSVGTSDALVYTCPTSGSHPPFGKRANIVATGIGSPALFGWGAFNGSAGSITCQAKMTTANATKISVGAPLTTATAFSVPTGPGSLAPGVPSSMINASFFPGDALYLTFSAAGMNVWVLIEEFG